MNRALITVAVSIGLALVASPAMATNPQVCGPLDSGKIDVAGSHERVTVTAPEGFLITGYCVKAGSVQQGNGPHYEPVEAAGVITFGHPSGKDVSHYSVSWVAIPTPSPEPSPEPSPSPSVTPVPSTPPVPDVPELAQTGVSPLGLVILAMVAVGGVCAGWALRREARDLRDQLPNYRRSGS